MTEEKTYEKRNSKGPRVAISIVGLIIALLGAFLFLYISGYRSGTEFSPDTFSMRDFSYRKMPVTGWVISGIKYGDHENFVGETLITDKWIVAAPEKQWDLVSERRSFSSSHINDDCDARFLVTELSQYDYDPVKTTSNNRWIAWSDKHDACGQVFWPLIAKLARLRMYLAIPDLMEFARHNAVRDDDAKADKEIIDQEVAKFSTEFKRRCSQALVRFAKVDEVKGNPSRALSRFKAAANIDNHPVAIASRDRLLSEGISESK